MMRTFDIGKMRAACKSAAETLRAAGAIIRPGITTDDVNMFVHNDTIKRGGYPAPLNYHGFPKSVCTYVNDVVCHGIPGALVLCDGDIINVDVTTILDGHFGDTSATFIVGAAPDDVMNLVQLTEQALHIGIRNVRPGRRLNVIGKTIQDVAQNNGYSVVHEFGGHGVGVRFHTLPHVGHYDNKNCDVVIVPGMVFTIEPMLNVGGPDITTDGDSWTVRTLDGSLSCQFEHTVLVTDAGCEVLTSVDQNL